MEDNFFDRLVSLKNEAIDFIAYKVGGESKVGSLNLKVNPDNTFDLINITVIPNSIHVILNGNVEDIRNLSREYVIMIAAYLDGSWDGE